MSTGSNYALSSVWSKEAERLDAQYEVSKFFFRRQSPVPSSINLESYSRIFDAAAGSLAWLRDVAEQPIIKQRLEEGKVKLYGCDITSAQFPPQEVIDRLKIETFLHDITQPFPTEFIGQFDFISLQIVAIGLDENAWMKTLENFRELLAPNGKILLREPSLVWFNPEKFIENAGNATDEDPYLFLDEYNGILKHSLIQKKGYISNLPDKLPEILTEANYKILSQENITGYAGGARKHLHLSAESRTLKAWDILENGLIASIGAMFQDLFEKGLLFGKDGKKIEQREELDAIAKRYEIGLKEKGAAVPFIEILAEPMPI